MDILVSKARELALVALQDETRYDGSPFIAHADNVAHIVEDEIGLPQNCVAAVYLHEATRIHKDLNTSDFPSDIRAMAEGLNKISTIKPKDTKLEAENYKRLIVQYSTDPRVTVIKIADRLEVMRNLQIFPKNTREQKLLETLMLYMPLAHQLGLYNINNELGNIYFRYSEPEEFRSITNKLKATEKDREKLMADFIRPLEAKLSEAGIEYKLKIRTKAAYSIYRKMQIQKLPFEKIFDVFAIRFIIDCEEDPVKEKELCWQVYSYVTEQYTPDTKRLRDWLTTPRPNGYESLHITVTDNSNRTVEVQIRTKRMDMEAENGSAAHWSYKGISHEKNLDRWLKSVRESLENPLSTSPEDLPEPPSKEIFVFTPSGELRILQAGSSVLDFAFNIHSGIGSRCTGGKVNGKPVQLKEKLKTGDVVEIMTSKNQRPGRDWLNWVVSSKARSKIKQELAADERKLASQGREILERRLKNWKLECPDEYLTELMKKHKFTSVLSLFAAIASEQIDPNEVKAFILQKQNTVQSNEEKIEEVAKKSFTGSSSDNILVINAESVKGIDYKLSKCCNPVFGDDVFGFVTRTSGITIHRMSCPNAARLMEKYPYRIQKVKWQTTSSGGEFTCNLVITAAAEASVLNSVISAISQFKASIRSFNVKDNTRQGVTEIQIKLLVPSNFELNKIVSVVSATKYVLKVRRI